MLHCHYIFVILMIIKLVKCSIYVSVNDRRKQASTSFSHVYSIERGSHILGCCFRLGSFTFKLLSEKISLKENVYSLERGSHILGCCFRLSSFTFKLLSEKISLKEHELFFVNSIFKFTYINLIYSQLKSKERKALQKTKNFQTNGDN